MDQKGAVMPFVLIVCFILTALVASQAALLLSERESLQAQRTFLKGNVLLEKGEEQWWEDFRRDRTSNSGSWRFREGTVTYEVEPRGGYEFVTLSANIQNGGQVQHNYYVQKVEIVEEDESEFDEDLERENEQEETDLRYRDENDSVDEENGSEELEKNRSH